MPITVKHSTLADGTFSATGATAWDADHTLSGLGTMAEQNANAVAITGGTATLTSVTTPIVQATNSAGLALKNSAGTTQISMGAGGGDNISLNSSTNLNGTNAQIDISPTGTGHVHIKPTGVNSVEIAPTYVGEMDNIVIGAVTPKAGTFTTITGQTGVLRGTGQNLLQRSSDLTVSPWSTVNVSLTGGQTDPFGGTTASLFNSGVAASTQHYLAQNYTALPTNTYTFSVYAKVGTTNFIGIYSSSASQGAFFNISTGVFTGNIVGAPSSTSITNAGNGWYRVSITTINSSTAAFWLMMSEDGTNFTFTGTSKTVLVTAPQLEIGNTLNTYIPTTTTAVYGTPTLSFSGVSTLGLESNGALFLQPAGTGAIQAQATTSTTAGGNVRGANAVDWQTARATAAQVASAQWSTISGGVSNTASATASNIGGGATNAVSNTFSGIFGGQNNTNTATYSFIGGGSSNTTGTNAYQNIVGGKSNTASGWFNFIGAGFTNSGTSASAVTTQSGTMNATTAVTLSGSNANIRVGQLITGTSIGDDTYVAAISGTSLTLSKVASGSSTSTLSFFTPHGVVVGGGNNQATGAYSAILGGGDAGTAANRNVASGDWSVVGGGRNNTASGIGSTIIGGYNPFNTGSTASGVSSVVLGGAGNIASGYYGVASGEVNTASGSYSYAFGSYATTRSISGQISVGIAAGFGSFAQGRSQYGFLGLYAGTTDATPTALRSDANAASGTNQVILPNNSAYLFKATVISGVTGGGNTSGWKLEGVIKRGANAASTTIVGLVTTTLLAQDAGAATWAIAATADTTNGGLRITFTGQASTTIRTVCKVETTEMTY